MQPAGIPDWNADGVLPPCDEIDPTSAYRSPYVVSLREVVVRFGTSAERLHILGGLLRHRRVLHDAGLVRGFQWLDGSFVEDIERQEGRPPNDIDVTTFFRLPAGMTQQMILANAPSAFDRATIRQACSVDAYVHGLDVSPDRLIAGVLYWYGVWSHRRNVLWKGYLQVDLAPAEDVAARTALEALLSREAEL